jgi:ACR3 family arsenite transporter
MALGIILGYFVPETGPALQRGQFVGVSVPIGMRITPYNQVVSSFVILVSFLICKVVGKANSNEIAIGLLIMMYPILLKVRYEALPALVRLRELWLQVLFSVIANWIVAPLLMLGLSWAFLPDRPELREGLILVGVARCIAMVHHLH